MFKMNQISLIEKLDDFIRKYYKNMCLRGGLIALGIIAAGVLVVSALENFSRFGVGGRTVLFYLILISVLGVVFSFVLSPILKLLKLGRIISHKEASEIIGVHFPEIQDKLLNTLQLQEQTDTTSSDLLHASIEKRTEELRPIPFANAIDFRANLTYLKYASFPVLVVVGVLFWSPNSIKEPAERIIQHRSAFEAPSPYRFVVISSPLTVPKGDDFEFLIRVEGQALPSALYLVDSGGRYRMERINDGVFSFQFNNVVSNTSYKCSANGWDSPIYELQALPVPFVKEFCVVATPPSYTGLDEIIQTNHGDLIIPEGSEISWDCNVEDASSLNFNFGDSVVVAEVVLGNRYKCEWRPEASSPYWIVPSNKELGAVDSLKYFLSVVADSRPNITLVEVEDTLTRSLKSP